MKGFVRVGVPPYDLLSLRGPFFGPWQSPLMIRAEFTAEMPTYKRRGSVEDAEVLI